MGQNYNGVGTVMEFYIFLIQIECILIILLGAFSRVYEVGDTTAITDDQTKDSIFANVDCSKTFLTGIRYFNDEHAVYVTDMTGNLLYVINPADGLID